jgi:hypothetical protein
MPDRHSIGEAGKNGSNCRFSVSLALPISGRPRDRQEHGNFCAAMAKMDVCRPHMADLGAIHQLAHGAVDRDGIADRSHRPYGVGAVGPRVIEPAHPRPLGVALVLVETLAVGLPEIEDRPRDRLAVEAAHRAADKAGNTRASLGHIAAVRNRGRVGHIGCAWIAQSFTL